MYEFDWLTVICQSQLFYCTLAVFFFLAKTYLVETDGNLCFSLFFVSCSFSFRKCTFFLSFHWGLCRKFHRSIRRERTSIFWILWDGWPHCPAWYHTSLVLFTGSHRHHCHFDFQREQFIGAHFSSLFTFWVLKKIKVTLIFSELFP